MGEPLFIMFLLIITALRDDPSKDARTSTAEYVMD